MVVCQVFLGRRVFGGREGHLELKEVGATEEQLGLRGQEVLKDSQEYQECKVLMVVMVYRENLVLMGFMAEMVWMEYQV